MIKRIIPLEEVAEHQYYWDMAELAKIFNHEIVEDDNGVWRWKANDLVCHLLHGASYYEGEEWLGGRTKTFRGSIDLNTLWLDFYKKKFTVEEMMKFNMQIGYSLSGFCEVFGQREAKELDLEGAKKPESDEEYTQTIIDYMVEKYKGQTLKL